MNKMLLYVVLLVSICVNSLSAPISDFTKPATLPKYFAIDVDDTFYIADETKFRKNVDAFKLLKDKNIIPFFCTGRHLACTKKRIGDSFFNETGYNGFPGVYLNGALVYDAGENLLFVNKFKSEFINKFVDYVETNNLKDKVFYYGIEGTFSLEEIYEEGLQDIRNNLITVPVVVSLNDLKSKDIIGITIFKLGMNESFMNEVYSVEYTKHNVTSIIPSVCSKKAGLEKLLQHLGSSGQECAFIGDDLNDVESMEYCYLSFAVANAKDKVKEKAKWVLDLNYDDCAFEKVVKLLCDDAPKTNLVGFTSATI